MSQALSLFSRWMVRQPRLSIHAHAEVVAVHLELMQGPEVYLPFGNADVRLLDVAPAGDHIAVAGVAQGREVAFTLHPDSGEWLTILRLVGVEPCA